MTAAASSRSRRCPGCGSDTRGAPPSGADAGVGTAGPIRATAEGAAPPRCPDCGTARAARERLTPAVRAAIAERLVGGAGRVGAAGCGACGTDLDLPMRATSRGLTVRLDDTAPFTVTVDLPLVRCGGCAVDNVPPELAADLERAVLTACGVPPAPRDGSGLLSRLRRRVGRGSPGHPSHP